MALHLTAIYQRPFCWVRVDAYMLFSLFILLYHCCLVLGYRCLNYTRFARQYVVLSKHTSIIDHSVCFQYDEIKSSSSTLAFSAMGHWGRRGKCRPRFPIPTILFFSVHFRTAQSDSDFVNQRFYARHYAIARRSICHGNSVCLSVCLSVCHTGGSVKNG